MNGVRKQMSGCQYLEIQLVVLYIQKRSETQLHTLRVPETAKVLGFSLLSVWRAVYGVGWVLCYFSAFWGIRSTQPTGLGYACRTSSRRG
ncbi:MAG: hypothetical protein OXI63_24535 [Candidatus Poribacteria bacterium]|nr:hypothetical protein [Candidatus Poribacteria bacterium]